MTKQKTDYSAKAIDIATKYLNFTTPSCIALETEIQAALNIAYEQGRKSVLDKMPSEEEFNVYLKELVSYDPIFDAYNWLKQRMGE